MNFDTARSQSSILHAFPFNSEKKRGGVAVKTVTFLLLKYKCYYGFLLFGQKYHEFMRNKTYILFIPFLSWDFFYSVSVRL